MKSNRLTLYIIIGLVAGLLMGYVVNQGDATRATEIAVRMKTTLTSTTLPSTAHASAGERDDEPHCGGQKCQQPYP